MGEQSGNLHMQAMLLIVLASVVVTAYVLSRVSGMLGRGLGQIRMYLVPRLLGMSLAIMSVQFVTGKHSGLGLLPSRAV